MHDDFDDDEIREFLSNFYDGKTSYRYFCSEEDKELVLYMHILNTEQLFDFDDDIPHFKYEWLSIYGKDEAERAAVLPNFDEERFMHLFAKVLDRMGLGSYEGEEGRKNLITQMRYFFSGNIPGMITYARKIDRKATEWLEKLFYSKTPQSYDTTMQLFDMIRDYYPGKEGKIKAYIKKNASDIDFNLKKGGKNVIELAGKLGFFDIAILLRDTKASQISAENNQPKL